MIRSTYFLSFLIFMIGLGLPACQYRIFETCEDGIQNGDETGIDCGGRKCLNDCDPCKDGIQNMDEEGVDCGGSYCLNECPSCNDGIKNQDEEEIDCGGTICDPCTNYSPCTNGLKDNLVIFGPFEYAHNSTYAFCTEGFQVYQVSIDNGVTQVQIAMGGFLPPEFSKTMVTGIYVFGLSPNEAQVRINYGGSFNDETYYANPGDSVYLNVEPNGKLVFEFCDLEFNGNFETFKGSGRLICR